MWNSNIKRQLIPESCKKTIYRKILEITEILQSFEPKNRISDMVFIHKYLFPDPSRKHIRRTIQTTIQISLFVWIILGLTISCQNKSSQPQKAHTPQKEDFHQITCADDSTQSYTVYLPSYYDSTQTWPVIYVFDAHARGNLAAQKMAAGAEEYGFVVCASNTFRNNIGHMQNIVNNLFRDSRNRFSIDRDHIFLAGFSGGARIANSIGLTNNSAEGIISCSAGIRINKEQISNKDAVFIGVTGKKDFNYIELKSTSRFLDQIGISNHLFVFDSFHQWPPQSILKEAMLGCYLHGMQKGFIPKNKGLINRTYQSYKKQIQTAQASSPTLKTYRKAQTGKFLFAPFNQSTFFKQAIDKLSGSSPVKDKLNLIQQLIRVEQNLRKKYQQAFTKKPLNWWNQQINHIHEHIHQSKDSARKYSYIRIQQFISMMSYMYSAKALNSENLSKAKRYLNIYQQIDPDNPDYYYLKAKYAVLNQNQDQAINSLNKAFQNGFDQLYKIEEDPTFEKIRNSKRYKNITNKI